LLLSTSFVAELAAGFCLKSFDRRPVTAWLSLHWRILCLEVAPIRGFGGQFGIDCFCVIMMKCLEMSFSFKPAFS